MPGRHGVAALLAAAAAFATGRVFGLIEMYVIGAALVATVLVAVVVANTRRPRLSVSRATDPPSPVAGSPISVTMTVTQRGAHRSPELSLWERVDGMGGATMTLAPLGAGQSTDATYSIPATRRGVLRCGPLQARRTDPLGLASRTHRLAEVDEVVVLPVTVTLAPPRIGSPGVLGQLLKAKAVAQGGIDFHGLRDYAPGDEPRKISWKHSARSTNLLVREHADDELRRVTIALDALIADHDAFERAVSAAASVLAACAPTELELRVVSQDADWRGPDVLRVAMRGLALIEPARGPAPVPPGPSTPEGLGVVVLVTDQPASAFVGAARAQLGRNQTVVTITTAAAGSPAAGGPGAGAPGPSAAVAGAASGALTVDGSSLANLAASWNRLVGDVSLGAMRSRPGAGR